MSHPAIRFTIYASLLCYVVALVCWVSRQRGLPYRVLWSLGCVLMIGHALAAFHFYHHWSHQHAVELTAAETEAVIGVPLGQGIWFSYLLLLVWLLDVMLVWIRRLRKTRVFPWLSGLIHLYAFFILFHGTVVFETGPVRWAGVVGTIWVLRMAWRFRSAPIRWG